MHGDCDLQAPFEICGRKTAQFLTQSMLKVYENAAHGLFVTHADRLNADPIAFVRRPGEAAESRYRLHTTEA